MKRWFSRISLGVLLLLVITFFSAQWWIKFSVNKVLAEHALVLDFSKLSINLVHLSVAVEDVRLIHKGSDVFSIDTISMNADWAPLFSKNLSIESIVIDGLATTASLVDEQLIIPGLFPNTFNNSSAAPIESDADTNKQGSDFPRTINIQEFLVTDLTFSLQGQKVQQLEIEKLQLADIDVQENDIKLSVGLDALLNKQTIELDGRVIIQPKTTVIALKKAHVKADLKDFQEWIPKSYNPVEALLEITIDDLTADIGADIQVNGKQIDLALNDTDVAVYSLLKDHLDNRVFDESLKMSLAQAALSLADINFMQSNANQGMKASAHINATIDALSIKDTEDSVLSVERSQLINGQIALSDTWAFSSEQWRVQNLVAMDLHALSELSLEVDESIQALANVELVEINNIQLAEQRYFVEDIDVKLNSVNVYRTKANSLANLPLSEQGEPVEASESIEPIEPAGKATPATIIVNTFELVGEPKITLFDYATSPALEQVLNIASFSVKGVDSSNKDSAADFLFNANVGKRSLIDISGEFSAFSQHKDLKGQGKVEGINLTRYSPYVSEALGYDIEKGLLFADFSVEVKNQEIKGEVVTDIKAIALSESLTAENADQASGIVPLNIAIKQLTDSKGNLVVDIPLSGRTDDPSFGIGGLIEIITVKAITEGAKSYLLDTFVPYASVVSVAMLAGEAIFEVKVNDLAYQPQQVDLKEPQLLFADELAALLLNKADEQLEICPVVTYVKDERELTGVLQKQLNKLGHDRVEIFIDYLIDKFDIAHHRLIPCKAKIRDAAKETDKLFFTVQ